MHQLPVNGRGWPEPAGILHGERRLLARPAGRAASCYRHYRNYSGDGAIHSTSNAWPPYPSSAPHLVQAPFAQLISPTHWSRMRTPPPPSGASWHGCPPPWRPFCRQACGTRRCRRQARWPGGAAMLLHVGDAAAAATLHMLAPDPCMHSTTTRACVHTVKGTHTHTHTRPHAVPAQEPAAGAERNPPLQSQGT